ncbi:hypothetical protein LPB072_06485 [Hydrogenophaga crassostreae]|uniref:DUF4148 domain-containing protein n=2 Tax=Hydrogenophaga crassostreae TaxID=1763535 RepID=A0A1D8NTW3_9BURK|nr:hypothetical protein LPB072_06485 [Hydrogenophaga crassostreae]
MKGFDQPLKETPMKNARIAMLALSMTAAATGSALASDTTAKTREQVRAEFFEAQQEGTLIANSETGTTFRQMYPGRYPAATASNTTRAQVRAELVEAHQQGTQIANARSGATYRDLYPNQYPTDMASTVTREQVRAELIQAQRNGTLIANGQSGATYRDLFPSRYPTMNDAGAAMLGLAPLPNATRMN